MDTKNSVEVMNLLLNLNHKGFNDEEEDEVAGASMNSKSKNGVTMVMATHNPDIEIYANRILYIKDGQIIRQVKNRHQMPLDYETYMSYLRVTQNIS